MLKTVYLRWKYQLHMYGKYHAVVDKTEDKSVAQMWANNQEFVTVEQQVMPDVIRERQNETAFK